MAKLVVLVGGGLLLELEGRWILVELGWLVVEVVWRLLLHPTATVRIELLGLLVVQLRRLVELQRLLIPVRVLELLGVLLLGHLLWEVVISPNP